MKEAESLNYNNTIQKSNDKDKTMEHYKIRNWQKNHK
jgi:hypothetical protein